MSLKRIGDIAPNINVSDPTYSADQIVGRTLIAKVNVTAYDEPEDGSNVVNSFNPGQTVGVVTSWEDANAALGISVLNWQFMDANGTPYYVPHYVGEFDIQALADQGALTAGQQTQAAIDANTPSWLVTLKTFCKFLEGSGNKFRAPLIMSNDPASL